MDVTAVFGEMRADLVAVPTHMCPETHVTVQLIVTDFYSSVGNNMACVLTGNLRHLGFR